MITSIYILNNTLCPKVQLPAQTNDLQYNSLGSNYGNHILPKKIRPTRKSGTGVLNRWPLEIEPPCPISELGGSDFDPTLGNSLEVMFHHSAIGRAAPRFDARAIRGCHAWSMGPWHAMHGRCAIPGAGSTINLKYRYMQYYTNRWNICHRDRQG